MSSTKLLKKVTVTLTKIAVNKGKELVSSLPVGYEKQDIFYIEKGETTARLQMLLTPECGKELYLNNLRTSQVLGIKPWIGTSMKFKTVNSRYKLEYSAEYETVSKDHLYTTQHPNVYRV